MAAEGGDDASSDEGAAQDDKPTPVGASTVVLISDWGDGLFTVAPLSDLGSAAIGSRRDAFAEQQLALEMRWKEQSAHQRVAMLCPEEAHVEEVDVEIDMMDDDKVTITAPAVVLEGLGQRWAVLTPIAHTTFVPKKAELKEVIAKAMASFAPAIASSPDRIRRLLQYTPREVERVVLELALTKGNRNERVEAQKAKDARKLLANTGRFVSAKPSDTLRRAPLVEELVGALCSDVPRSVVLVGAASVGKSSVARAAAATLSGRVVQTSPSQLVAGASALGELEERISSVVEAAQTIDAILYFDDFASLASGKTAQSIAQALTRIVDDRAARVLTEATPEDWARLERVYPSLTAPFIRLNIEELSQEDTEFILADLAKRGFEANQHGRVDTAALRMSAHLAERFLPYTPNPGGALSVLSLTTSSSSSERIDANQVVESFALAHDLPEKLLSPSRALRHEEVEAALRAQVIAQDQAVAAVAEVICVFKAGLAPRDRPIASFMFAGPTGVGKTELGRALARYLFGSSERLLRFDMSEYADADGAARLVRGHDGRDGHLTAAARRRPFSVLLLDEIEKAHPLVMDVLLQVLGEGRLSDGKGRTAYFHNTIIILTTNLGSKGAAPISLGNSGSSSDTDKHVRAIEEAFRPELVGRLDRIVPFASLDEDAGVAIVSLLVESLSARVGLTERNIALTVSEGCKRYVVREGYERAMGARALRRTFERLLVDPLSDLIARLDPTRRDLEVAIRALEEPDIVRKPERSARVNGLHFALKPTTATERKNIFDTVSTNRLAVDRVMSLDGFANAESRLSVARAMHQSGKAGPKQYEDLGRYEQSVGGAREALKRIEEIECRALDEGVDPETTLEAVLAARAEVERHVLDAIFLGEPSHSAIVLRATSITRGPHLRRWLESLAIIAAERKWQVEARVRGERDDLLDAPPDTEPSAWGPKRDLSYIIARFEAADTSPRDLLMFIKGRWSGALLSLDMGYHRYTIGKKMEYLRFVKVHGGSELKPGWRAKPELKAEARVDGVALTELRLKPAAREIISESVRVGGAVVSFAGSSYLEIIDRIALTQLVSRERRDK